MNSGPVLAIQLCRFSNQGGQLLKDETFVSCTQSQPDQYLTVIPSNEVTLNSFQCFF